MSRYAADTQVSPERSRAEIERTLAKYGATDFGYMLSASAVMIAFRASDRAVRFALELPPVEAFARGGRGTRSAAAMKAAQEQAIRQRWRCLALAIKAKLEVVESGISTFEQEFLAHIVLADGKTVAQKILPAIADDYRSGKPVPLLLAEAP